MPFEEWSGDCMKRLYTRLEQAGVPIKMTPEQACNACRKPECNQNLSGTSKENVYIDPKDLDPNLTVEENIRLRRERLEAQWKREQK